jgi:hypothetical protein
VAVSHGIKVIKAGNRALFKSAAYLVLASSRGVMSPPEQLQFQSAAS